MSTPICSFIPEVFSCIISFAFGCICILNTEIISYGHTYQSSQYLIKTRTATYPKATVPFLYYGNLCIKYGRSRTDRLKKVMGCDNISSGRRENINQHRPRACRHGNYHKLRQSYCGNRKYYRRSPHDGQPNDGAKGRRNSYTRYFKDRIHRNGGQADVRLHRKGLL